MKKLLLVYYKSTLELLEYHVFLRTCFCRENKIKYWCSFWSQQSFLEAVFSPGLVCVRKNTTWQLDTCVNRRLNLDLSLRFHYFRYYSWQLDTCDSISVFLDFNILDIILDLNIWVRKTTTWKLDTFVNRRQLQESKFRSQYLQNKGKTGHIFSYFFRNILFPRNFHPRSEESAINSVCTSVTFRVV